MGYFVYRHGNTMLKSSLSICKISRKCLCHRALVYLLSLLYKIFVALVGAYCLYFIVSNRSFKSEERSELYELFIERHNALRKMYEIQDVIDMIKDSEAGIPISEELQRSGNIYDNLCILHNSEETKNVLGNTSNTARLLTIDDVLSTCKRNSTKGRVPNRVFYVIFGSVKFTFIHYLSFLSVHKFVRPERLYLVGDRLPVGPWWDKVMFDIPYVKFVFWRRPQSIYGRAIRSDIHASDIVRLHIFMIDGGIYLDTDLLILRSLQPLAHHILTMGLIDNGTGVGNGFVMAQRANQFLRLWYMSHKNFDPDRNYFGAHSMQVPLKLWHLFPHLIHVEKTKIYTPSWNNDGHYALYKGQYDWSTNYAVHVWHNTKYAIPKSFDDVRAENNTLAQIIRHIINSPVYRGP